MTYDARHTGSLQPQIAQAAENLVQFSTTLPDLFDLVQPKPEVIARSWSNLSFYPEKKRRLALASGKASPKLGVIA